MPLADDFSSSGVLVIFICQPTAHHGVAAQQQHQRMQPAGLHARSHEQRQVEAGGQLLVDDSRCQAHSLPRALEAGGWSAIHQPYFAKGRIETGHLCTHAVGGLRLIFVERARACQFFEQGRCPQQDGRQFRDIGHDKGGEQLGRHLHAGPLVESQEAQLERLLCQWSFVGLANLDGDVEMYGHALGELAQRVGLGHNLQTAQYYHLPTRHQLQMLLTPLDKVATQPHCHLPPIGIGGVFNLNTTQTLLTVLPHGIIQLRQVVESNHFIHRCFLFYPSTTVLSTSSGLKVMVMGAKLRKNTLTAPLFLLFLSQILLFDKICCNFVAQTIPKNNRQP